jgi:hypothetical protein
LAALRGQFRELGEVCEMHHFEADKWLFAERFIRWKERTIKVIERYASAYEAGKFSKLSHRDVSYDQHRDSQVKPHSDFLRVLIEDIERHGLPHPQKPSKQAAQGLSAAPTMQPKQLFLSHAGEDQALAEYIRERLITAIPGVSVFLTSLPGQIPAGAEWWDVIKQKLREADSYFILLTPISIAKLWVSFETGAAWMTERPLVVAAAGGLAKTKIPLPLSTFHVYSLENEREAVAVFERLQGTLMDAAGFCARVREFTNSRPRIQDDAGEWKGVNVGGRFFSWDGFGLHSLPDRPPVPTPAGLTEGIKAAGVDVRYNRKDRLTDSFAKGWQQVFETDCKTFRREILLAGDGDQVLMAKE